MNIYVLEDYFTGKIINGYTLENAPILLPNTVGGYRFGMVAEPNKSLIEKSNIVFEAIAHGYIVVSAGIRGRGLEHGVGVAPACIVDYKSVVRYLRYNKENIPGDVDKIISNGTSAGGALSCLLGVTGNHIDYEMYLNQIGAAKAEDHIFASSCYCPITNLEHADMAYEWEFAGQNDYYSSKDPKTCQQMDVDQIKMSYELRELFYTYFEKLRLELDGKKMNLKALQGYIEQLILVSANDMLAKGESLASCDWLTICENQAKSMDFAKFIQYRKRMKTTPAFDDVWLKSPENELFGTCKQFSQHFTKYSFSHSKVDGQLAGNQIVKMMNPMNYIDDQKATKAKFFRLRHGTIDCDTSLSISAILAIKLQNAGFEVDHYYPWDVAHAGDYDLIDLFDWIDSICKQNN